MSDIRLYRGLSIPESDVELRFSRSGGPGGQKVNTSATKVELRFDLDANRVLTPAMKERVRARLGNRITKDGVLILQSSEYRTQGKNRRAVVARFRNLLREALRPAKQRRPTKPPRSADRRRLEEKRKTAERKRLRQSPEVPRDR